MGRRRQAAAVGARETAARLLWWRIGDEEGSVSCARTRRMVGSARAEVVWRCGATVSFKLAGVRAGGDDVLGFLTGSGRESEGIGLRGFQ